MKYGKQKINNMNFLEEFKEYITSESKISYELVSKHIDDSQKRFSLSRGWNSGEFGKFTDDFMYAIAWKSITSSNNSSFFKNNVDLIKLYQDTQYIDLMRMLSYSESLTNDYMKNLASPITNILEDKFKNLKEEIVLVDYGCGLAYWTIHMAEILVSKNIPCKLVLIDIYRESFINFIDFLCKKRNIPYEYLEVTHEKLVPDIPKCDYAHVMAVLEHTSEPVKIIQTIVDNIRDNGIIYGTFYDDPFDDYQHISYDLSDARNILEDNKKYKINNLGPYWNKDTTMYQVFKS